MTKHLSRRRFLGNAGAIGCSLAASPLVAPISMASLPSDNRLVVIVLRGAMDGLDVVQPYGDSYLAPLRPNLEIGEAADAVDLDGFFSMHSALNPLMPLWQAGELGFAHAVSTPYRGKRSHFDGQDILETGGLAARGGSDGWMNRLLATMPNATGHTAFSVGRDRMQILDGAAPVAQWAPNVRYGLDPEMRRLLQLVHDGDPLFEQASDEAIAIAEQVEDNVNILSALREQRDSNPLLQNIKLKGEHVGLAQFAVSQLLEDTRLISFSMGGWDTHRNQAQSMKKRLEALSATLATLKVGLSDIWDRTAVMCITEFGRTVAENGSRGTDHGTAGAMIYAGGALKGGQVIANWPGVSEFDLFEGRDLMPTRDVRAHLAWAIHGLFGLDSTALETMIFPELELGENPGIVL